MIQTVTTDDILDFIIPNKDRFYLIGRCFNRRVFCKIGNITLISTLCYDIDNNNHAVTVYLKFSDEASLIIKQYKYAPDSHINLLIKSIKKEFLRQMPQIPGCRWSFFIEEVI